MPHLSTSFTKSVILKFQLFPEYMPHFLTDFLTTRIFTNGLESCKSLHRRMGLKVVDELVEL